MKNVIIIGIAFIVSLVCVSILSARFSMQYTESLLNEIYAEKLDEIQASLSFNHLQNYKKIEQYIENDCNDESVEYLKHYQELQISLIYSHYLDKDEVHLEKMNYMLKKDPQLYKEIKDFESVPAKTWSLPTCNKF